MAGDMLSHQQIAEMIDISAVQAFHGEADIRDLVRVAHTHGFGAVHVLPTWVPYARSLLEGVSGISLGSPVGFPSGGSHTLIKLAEAVQLVADGVDELDMMINVGKLRSGDAAFVLHDIHSVVSAVSVPVKVIIETHYLSDEQIELACELCIQAGAQFVKTATGWAETGATLENIRLIAERVQGRIGIKAAGGIRDLATLVNMHRLGVRRFGINVQAAVAIVEAAQRQPQGVVRL